MNTLNQQTKVNAIPNQDIFYTKFKLNGSPFLNIDGTTPKVFRLEDLTMDNIILNRVDFLISAGADIDLTKFGGVTLANGVQFNIDGSQLFKTNGDILLFATDASIYSAKVEGVLTTVINGHWDLVKAFQNGVVCNVEDLTVVIQDNLSTLNFFEVSASGVKL